MTTHINKNDVVKVLKINMACKGYNILSEYQNNATELVEEAIKRKQEECVKESRKKSKIGVNPDDFTLEQEILESSGEFDNDYERLEKCSTYDLKQMCKEYNISQIGHKTDLVERIAEYLHDQRGFNARISSVYNSVRSSVNNTDSGESVALKEDEVSLLGKLMEEEEKDKGYEKVNEKENNKNEIVVEEPPNKHIQSPSPLHRPTHKAILVLKNQDLQIESPIIEKPLKSVKPKLDMAEIESNIEETADESELKRKIKLELEKRKVVENKSKEINTPKTIITPRTLKPNPNPKSTIKYNPIIAKLKNTVSITKATPIHSSHKQLPTNSAIVNNNNSKQENPIQLVHPISTPILNHKCSKVFVINNNNNNNNKQDDKKKVNSTTSKGMTNNNQNNNENNHENNNENENKENNCVENKKSTENNEKKKCNTINNNKSNQEDWTSGEELQKQLKYQYDHYIDLECIFGKVKMSIFPNCQETLRGSSGDWRNDGLTDEEREEYRREVELKKML